jgi:hypothetical protein
MYGVDTILTNSNKPWLVPIHGQTQVGQIKTCIQNKSGGSNDYKTIRFMQLSWECSSHSYWIICFNL